MMYVVYGLLSAITLVKGKKQCKLLDILFLIALVIIGGLSTKSPDYQVYYDFFQYHSLSLDSISEPLYLLINILAFKSGMSYQVFFALQVAFCMILLYRSARYFDVDVSFVLMLFALFPFAINVVQIRYFLSISIVIYGLVYLFSYYETAKLSGLMKFIAAVLVASLIHYSSAFFLICIVPVWFRKMKPLKTSIFGFVFGVALSNIDILFSLLTPIIGARKAGNWLSGNETFSLVHVLFIALLRVVLLSIVILVDHTVQLCTIDEVTVVEKTNSLDSFLYKEILFLVVVIMPMELFVQQYDRFTRLYLVLFYFFVARRIVKVSLSNKVIIGMLLLAFMLLLCYYEYSRGTSSGDAIWNTVFRSVFENNVLLN